MRPARHFTPHTPNLLDGSWVRGRLLRGLLKEQARPSALEGLRVCEHQRCGEWVRRHARSEDVRQCVRQGRHDVVDGRMVQVVADLEGPLPERPVRAGSQLVGKRQQHRREVVEGAARLGGRSAGQLRQRLRGLTQPRNLLGTRPHAGFAHPPEIGEAELGHALQALGQSEAFSRHGCGTRHHLEAGGDGRGEGREDGRGEGLVLTHQHRSAPPGVDVHSRAVRVLVIHAECRQPHGKDALLQFLALVLPTQLEAQARLDCEHLCGERVAEGEELVAQAELGLEHCAALVQTLTTLVH
mmetsp:Transcript_32345/g.104440  ORF Transcript_32345/g.104440 Transcript_32345/m.104440 type:complete len:298 (-) Transcript_32345:67-960(-)